MRETPPLPADGAASGRRRLRAWASGLALAGALVLLNSALTFHNVWPTPAVRLASPPELSAELALVLLILAAWAAFAGRARGAGGPSAAHAPGLHVARLAAPLAVLTLLFALARYAEVTAPALYGRPIDLYWDAPHFGNVARMLAVAAGPLLATAFAAAAVLVLYLAYLLCRLAWTRVLRGLPRPTERRAVATLAGAILALWAADLAGQAVAFPRISIPVAQTYGAQARLVVDGWRSARWIAVDEAAVVRDGPAAGPGTYPAARHDAANVDPRFHALAGDDVLLVFVESYGSVAWTRPEFVQRLAGLRAELAAAVADTGRQAVSATVVAPTFGGNSWLSHLSLLSGTAVRDPGAYARQLKGSRPTLVRDFARAGYRTIALMPGLRQAWPEGSAYGFDAILGADALEWRGPPFGWWGIPDQYALAKLSTAADADRPRFVFFPTISSHAPFRPMPPYQADWSRLLGPVPFGPEAAAALAREPDWLDLGPAYGDALAYVLQWLGGWLRLQADAHATLVVVGDHQPPAAVSGPGADWTVPVHVISRRAAALDALRAAGFVPGLVPPRDVLGELHELQPRLLAAFRGAGAAREVPTMTDVSGTPAASPHSVHAARVDVAGGAALAAIEQALP